MDIFTELFGAIESLKTGNVVGVGGILMFAVRLYRMIPNAPWPSQKWNWLVALVIFLVGFLVAMFTGVFGFGLSWGAAVLAALGVAVNAAGLNGVTSAIGAAVMPPQSTPVVSPFRAAASIVLPPAKIER